jgi:3D (Asp-Asp-Asp) domain-containing protein
VFFIRKEDVFMFAYDLRRVFAIGYLVAVVCLSAFTSHQAVHIEPASHDMVAIENRTLASTSVQECVAAPAPTTESQLKEKTPKKIIANCSGYTAAPDECGGNDTGITASGKKAVEGVTVAMDDVPLGTKIRINGHEYIVEDRFGGGYTNRVDIFFNNKADALYFGRQNLEVEILG